jgi:hypothetical protein
MSGKEIHLIEEGLMANDSYTIVLGGDQVHRLCSKVARSMDLKLENFDLNRLSLDALYFFFVYYSFEESVLDECSLYNDIDVIYETIGESLTSLYTGDIIEDHFDLVISFVLDLNTLVRYTLPRMHLSDGYSPEKIFYTGDIKRPGSVQYVVRLVDFD